jgi:hypothetical protein
MYLSVTFILASLSVFVEAMPTLSGSGFAIPIHKRDRLRDANGVLDIVRLQRSRSHSITFVFLAAFIQRISPHTRSVFRKINRGFDSYKQNTGVRHPFAPDRKLSEKRDIGSDPIIDLEWYCDISVGTPAKTFTGER